MQLRKTKQAYALKEMSKVRIIDKRSVQSVINERRLLAQLKHPYGLNLLLPLCQVFDQHELRILRPIESVPRFRSVNRWGLTFSHRKATEVQRTADEVHDRMHGSRT